MPESDLMLFGRQPALRHSIAPPILAVSHSVGLGLQAVPEALQHLPKDVTVLIASGLLPVAFLAVVLNMMSYWSWRRGSCSERDQFRVRIVFKFRADARVRSWNRKLT